MKDSKLKSLSKFVDAFDAETLTAKDFTDAFEKVTVYVKEHTDLTTGAMTQIADFLKEATDKLQGDTSSKFDSISESLLAQISTIEEAVEAKYPQFESAIDKLKIELSSVRSFEESDKKEIIDSVLAKVPKQEKVTIDTPDELIGKVNKSSLKIKKERVEGLVDVISNAVHNAVAVAPTTTHIYANSGLVGRAKNLNFTSAATAVSLNGDTATINLTAGASGVSSVVGGTDISVDSSDPANPIVNYTGSSSGITRLVTSTASPLTAGAAAAKDYVYLVTGTTTITLPTAVGNTNLYTIKNVGANTVTIATTSAQTIDGSASATLPVQYTSLDLISDNANWNVV